MQQLLKLALVSTVLILSVAGCSTPLVAPVKKEVQTNDKQALAAMKSAQRGNGAMQEEHKSAIEFVDTLWLPSKREEDVKAKLLSKETLTRAFTVSRDFHGMPEVAERITQLTQIPVDVAADVIPPVTAANAAKPAVALPAVSGGGPLPPQVNGSIGASTSGGQAVIFLSYTGTLTGFLDITAARFGVSWEWSDNKIHFFRQTTKTFKIVALPGDTAMQALVSNQSGNGSGSGVTPTTSSSTGGTQSNASTVTGATSSTGISYSGMSVWKALEDSIKGMLSKGAYAGNVVVTPATSSVTVTDTPQILERVRSFIAAQNESLSKQVVVNVKVLSVDLNDGDEYGINLSTLYSSLSGNYGMSLSNAFTTGTGDSNLALKVLGTSGTGVTGNGTVKAWQGSQAILAALSQQGHVSQITSAALMTLNNQAAPLQVGTETAFLQSSATTLTANIGQTTTLTPGMFTTGFSMAVVPNIMDNNTLLLQYDINISSLISLTQVSSNGSSIQTPSIATRNFLQRVRVNTGDTLVMTGFEQTNASATAQGVGNANNMLFGGGMNATKSHSVLVILIQPIVGDQ